MQHFVIFMDKSVTDKNPELWDNPRLLLRDTNGCFRCTQPYIVLHTATSLINQSGIISICPRVGRLPPPPPPLKQVKAVWTVYVHTEATSTGDEPWTFSLWVTMSPCGCHIPSACHQRESNLLFLRTYLFRHDELSVLWGGGGQVAFFPLLNSSQGNTFKKQKLYSLHQIIYKLKPISNY